MKRYRSVACKGLFVALLLVSCLLAGCAAFGTTAPATLGASTAPSAPTWPEKPAADAELFRVHQYNGSLRVRWEAEDGLRWIEDPAGNCYYLKELDHSAFYRANAWIRMELTEAGQHYCDASWAVRLKITTKLQYDGRDWPMRTSVSYVPYYLDSDGSTLGGWIVFGGIPEPAVAELTLAGGMGDYTQKVWLAPGLANTYEGPAPFSVEVLPQKLEPTAAGETVCSVQWNGQTYYCYNDIYMDYSYAMILTLREEAFDPDTDQTVSLHVDLMSQDMDIYSFKMNGAVALYVDPELTQWANIYYVIIGRDDENAVGLTLSWTEKDGVYAYSQIVYFDLVKPN